MVLAMNDHPRAPGQLSTGMPDDAFVTDGLLTKRVLRSFALAMLAPRPGERLWDLGAGTGSIAIEWCRLHADNSAVAVERDAQRAARIGTNAANLHVSGQLDVQVAEVASVLDQLPRPDAVFVGGGVEPDVLQRCRAALPLGGRLVAHSVTADSDAVLLEAYRRWGGEMCRVGVEVAEPIGRLTGFRPLRSVTSWAATKR